MSYFRGLLYSLSAVTCACSSLLADAYAPAAAAPKEEVAAKVVESNLPFKPFTGKVKAKKVRVRVQPDLESHVVRELDRNTVLSIVGETEGFWAVEPVADIKAYVFRSFVLDNVVEGHHVNIRIEPNLEAPVIGVLNSGDRVQGTIAPQNNKWLEIALPAGVRFWVAKDLIEYMGGPELKAQYDKRKNSVDQLLESAALLSKSEMRKGFEEIDFARLSRAYNVIIQDYSDFQEAADQAKAALTILNENYTQKKIAYLEAKAYNASQNGGKAAPLAEESSSLVQEEFDSLLLSAASAEKVTDKMRIWEPLEEAIYLTWAQQNEDRSMQDFYDDERLDAIALSGILETYTAPVKNKPGDFVLKMGDLPVAYLYSTQVNLQAYVGKKVNLVATERPNNNFAFHAYFVHEVE